MSDHREIFFLYGGVMVKIEVKVLIDGCGIDKDELLITFIFEELLNLIDWFGHRYKYDYIKHFESTYLRSSS